MAEEITKKRTRKTQKFQRAIGSVPLADIMAKRNQKPEVRKAQREAAIKLVKLNYILEFGLKICTKYMYANCQCSVC